VKGRFKITDKTSEEVALPSRIYQKKTNMEPADHDKITPLLDSMFTKPSPNSRKKPSIFLEKKRPKMYMRFFYMELEHIGLSIFKHRT